MSETFDAPPLRDSDVIRHHSQSFSIAARLLPKEVRGDVEKLYAWCRWCDNAVDDAPSREIAENQLQRLRTDVELIYDGQKPVHDASLWLADLVSRYAIPKDHPLDLLAGMEMDLAHRPIQSQQDLLLYCHRAAGTVGLMMCYLLGTSDAQALSHADSLGMAMQMTNIARDVKEDHQRGRCYLPECWLDQVRPTEALSSNKDVRPAIRRLLMLADQHYAIGIAGLRYLPPRSQRAIRVASDLYREIGETIRRNDYCVMDGRAFVPLPRKMLLVANSLRRSLTSNNLSSSPAPNTSSVVSVSSTHLGPKMNKDATYLATLGVSLTAIMATAMFVLVALNPKDAAIYSNLPWIYASVSALIACVSQWALYRMTQAMPQQTVNVPSDNR